MKVIADHRSHRPAGGIGRGLAKVGIYFRDPGGSGWHELRHTLGTHRAVDAGAPSAFLVYLCCVDGYGAIQPTLLLHYAGQLTLVTLGGIRHLLGIRRGA